MMKTFMLLVLSLGLFGFAFGNRLRIFNISSSDKNWNISLDICEQKHESLVTVYDEDDTVAFRSVGRPCWLGLHKRHSNITTWSNGELLTFSLSQVNTIDDNQTCEAMGNKIWNGFRCSDRKPFMCYKDNNYILIEEKKNWCQALQFCRRHYTDLVSISNETQNEEVFKKGKNKSFWIGLQHDQWVWADNSCSTYRKWDNPNTGKNCATTTCSPPSVLLHTFGCELLAETLCTKGNVRIQVVRQNLTWEQALDYCKDIHTGLLWIEDDNDQDAVEQWLHNTKAEGPFWIGLRQSSLFGFWIWSDRPVSYSNWKDGKIPEMPMSNHCGAIMKTENGWKWTDENCLNPLNFLCEEEIVFMEKSAQNNKS